MGGCKSTFIKTGSRAVRYRLSDLEAYVQSRLRLSTSDQGARI